MKPFPGPLTEGAPVFVSLRKLWPKVLRLFSFGPGRRFGPPPAFLVSYRAAGKLRLRPGSGAFPAPVGDSW